MIFEETREMVETWKAMRYRREELRVNIYGLEEAMRQLEHKAASVLGFGGRDNTRHIRQSRSCEPRPS